MSSYRLTRLHRSEILRTLDYLPMLPVVMFFSLASQQNLNVQTTLWPWFLVNVVSLAITAAVFWAFAVIIHRSDADEVSLGVLATIGALLGVVKGASTGLGGVLAGLEASWVEAIFSRVPQSTLLGVLVVVGISVASHARHVLKQQRRLLVASSLNQQVENLHHLQDIDAPLIRRALLRTRQALSQPVSSQVSLKDVAEGIVRPLSHELWQSQQQTMPPVTLRSVYWRALRQKTFSPLLTGFVWWVTVVSPLVQRSTVFVGLTVSLSVAALFAGVLWGVSRVRVSHPLTVLGLIVAGFAVVVFGGSLVGVFLVGDLFPLSSVWVQVSSFGWALLVTIGLTTLQAVFTGHSDLEERVGRLLTDDDIQPLTAQSLEAIVSDRLARFLHGEVVNKLLLLAHKQTAGDDVDFTAESETTRLLRQLDSGTWLTPGSVSHHTFAQRLDQLCEAWRGIMAVSYHPTPPPVTLDAITEANLVEALLEAVSNAYRHGLSSEVTISFTPSPGGGMEVLVEDNGLGPLGGPPRLGSSLYSQVSPGQWELTPHDSGRGAVLRLTVQTATTPSRG